MSIGLNHYLPLIPIFNIFRDLFPRDFVFHYKPPLNTLQLTIFEVLMFHENTELIPPGDSSDLYPGNNESTYGIMRVLVGIPLKIDLAGWS